MYEDEPSQNAVRLHVKVVPGSRRDQIVGRLGDRLKVKVAAPPEGGRANESVCRLIAEAVGVNARSVEVVVGHASPEKTLRIAGCRAADLARVWG